MKKSSLFDYVHLLLGANIILWLNSGTYRLIGDALPSFLKLGLVALWFIISVIKCKRFLSRYAVVVYLLALFYFICILSNIAGNGSYFSQYGMTLLYIMIEIAVLCYYYCYGTKKELRFLLTVYFLDMAVILIRTFIMLQENPDVVRLLSTSAEHKYAVFDSNIPTGIGAYGFCYQLVLLQPLLSYFLNKKQVAFGLKVLIYGLILMFLFQAQITLALIMYPVLLLISYAFGQRKRSNQALGKLLLAAISILLLILLPSILQELIQSSEVHLAARLEELYLLITAQDTSGDDMQSRLTLYQKSLLAFLNSPLWGGFGKKVYGSHSTMLDMLGAFGIFGAVGYCGLLRPFNLVRRDFAQDPAVRAVLLTTLCSIVLLSVVNVVTSSDIMMTVLVIIPLTLRALTDREDTQIETDPN